MQNDASGTVQADSIRVTILALIGEVAGEMGRELVALTDELPLIETGLDSLGFAILVARLEERLDLDPFGSSMNGSFPVTFGDFIGLYERAAA